MTTNTRPAHGMVVYSKTPVTPLDVSMKNVEMILVEIFDTQVLFVYKQPLTNSAMLLNALTVVVNEHMQGRDIVILGDFNVDFSKRSPQQDALQKFASDYGLQQQLCVPTTDYHSTIDLIFTNIINAQTGVLETYFSDHKAIWIGM